MTTKLNLNDEGALSAGQGVGNLLKAFAMAPQMRQQAAQNQEAVMAKIFADSMHGRKLSAEANDQEMTTRYREGVDAELATNQSLTPYERALRIGFKYAGPQHMQNWSSAAEKEKKIADVAAIQANPALAQTTGIAYGAIKGELPFTSVNDGGHSFNRYTGSTVEANPVLAKIFSDKKQSEIQENRAQAKKASSTDGLKIGQIRDDIRADFNAMHPLDITRARPKDSPSYEEFTKQWLRQYNIPEAQYFKAVQKEAGWSPEQSTNGAAKDPKPQTPISAKTRPKERKVGALYETPKGLLIWNGTGWVPPGEPETEDALTKARAAIENGKK